MIVTPKRRNRLRHGVTWCFDSGCGPTKSGEVGSEYPGDKAFLTMLGRLADCQADCLFAVAPDVLGDAEATLARSFPMLPKIRALGYSAVYVAQRNPNRREKVRCEYGRSQHYWLPWLSR
jgi:hypothetical protein